jgi:hypothetical protein
MSSTSGACSICKCGDHVTDAHFDAAFVDPTTGNDYPVPTDIRVAAIDICRAYTIRGLSDPMYVANVIASRTGRGDGKSNFTDPVK